MTIILFDAVKVLLYGIFKMNFFECRSKHVGKKNEIGNRKPQYTTPYMGLLYRSRGLQRPGICKLCTRNETDGYSNTGLVPKYSINVKLFPILGKSRFGNSNNNIIIFDFDKAP